MSRLQNRMTAIVLAGQRDGEDELARYAGATCKAFVEIGGEPMLSRVLDTLSSSSCIGKILLSGPGEDKLLQKNEIAQRIQSGEVIWLAPRESPSTSTCDALRSLSRDDRVLLTTADHPLLSVSIVDEFCNRSADLDMDIVVGLAPYSLVHDAYPQMHKTVLRFKEGGLCGCNLFAFLTADGREAANFWRRTESERKKPLRVMRSLGWLTLAKYFLGRLTLEDALGTLSRQLGLRVGAIILPYADAAVDVDSVSDYQIVQSGFQRLPDIMTPDR